MTPNLLIRFGVRAAALWIVVRVALAALLQVRVPGLPPPDASPIRITPPGAILVAALVAALVLLDVRALRERVFLANLGVGLPAVAAAAFTTAALFELIVFTVYALA